MRSSRIELAEFLGTRTVSAGTVSPIVPSLTLVADSAVPHLAGEIDLSLLQVCERPVPNPPGKVFPIVHLPDHQIARRYRTPYIGLNKASSHPSTSCLLDLLLSYCEVEKNAIAAPSPRSRFLARPLGGTEQKTPSRRWLRRENTKKGSGESPLQPRPRKREGERGI